jgi:hypothetical protein
MRVLVRNVGLALTLGVSSISVLNAQDALQPDDQEKHIDLDAPLLKVINVAQAAFRKDQPAVDDYRLAIGITDRGKLWIVGIIVSDDSSRTGIREEKLSDGSTVVRIPSAYNQYGHSMQYEIDKATFKILRSYVPR